MVPDPRSGGRRPRHLLSGKAFCGICGRTLSLFGRDYMGCKAASHGTCRNRRTIRRVVLQDRVMDALRGQLMQPELVEEFIVAFNQEWRRLAGEVKAQAAARQRERLSLDRKIANLIEAIADGRSSPAIMAKLAELETHKAELGDLPSQSPTAIPALHPSIAQVYAEKVRNLEAGLANRDDAEVLEAARSLIDKVILHPPDGNPPRIELVGDLMALLRAAGISEPPSGSDAAVSDHVLGVFVSSVKAAPGASR
jgi:site-specific DNA recombinase